MVAAFILSPAQRAFLGTRHYHKNLLPKTWFMRTVFGTIAASVLFDQYAKWCYSIPEQVADSNLIRWNWNSQRLAVKHAKLQGLHVPEQYAHLAGDDAAADEE